MSEDTGAEATLESTDTSAQDAVAEAVNTEVATEAAAWSWSESVAGEGDAPDWFKSSKYKSVDEQAKAYNELEGKFGSFSGAPEDYEIKVSAELAEKGIEFTADDPIMEEAIKIAKESGMSQEGFEKYLELQGMVELSRNDAEAGRIADEIKSLGNRGEERVSNLDSWAKANMPSDLYEGFVGMAQSADAVKAMEQMIAMTRNAPVVSDATQATPGVSSEEVKAMQFAKDDRGNRRIQTDPEFKAKFEKMAAEVWGSEDHRIVVG
jgi:hypothetical protein